MKKLVILDWNGTLLSDTRATFASDNYILQKFGGKKVDLKIYRNTIIIPAIKFYTQHGCDRKKLLKNSKKIAKLFEDFYEQKVAKCRTRKSAKELLKWLHKNNIETIIASNHTLDGISYQLKRLDLEKYISKIIANDNHETSMKNRSKRDKLQKFLKNKKIDMKDITIIGDSMEETEIGKYFGMQTIAISRGYYSKKRLKEAKPDFLIDNLSKVINIIKK